MKDGDRHHARDQEAQQIGPDMQVETVLRQWPATLRVFLDRRMLCVGCPIGRFHTLSEACHLHGLDEEEFLRAIAEAAGRMRKQE